MQDDKTEIQETDEDSGRETDFNDVELYVEKSNTITVPDEKPQPKERGGSEPALDEEVSTQQQKLPSKDNVESDTSKSEEDKGQSPKPETKKIVYKLKEENRVPQSRVNQMARQRRIVEQRYNDLYQKHQETVQYLRRLQANGVAIPQELTTKLETDFKSLEQAENQRFESRKDEADEWLNAEVEKYTSAGFTFPVSFIRELANIVVAEGLQAKDPVEAYQAAFKIWSDDNVDVSEETIKTDASNQGGNTHVEKLDPKAEAKKADAQRQAAKSKATGVPRTKNTQSRPVSKPQSSPFAVSDEETAW